MVEKQWPRAAALVTICLLYTSAEMADAEAAEIPGVSTTIMYRTARNSTHTSKTETVDAG